MRDKTENKSDYQMPLSAGSLDGSEDCIAIPITGRTTSETAEYVSRDECQNQSFHSFSDDEPDDIDEPDDD